MDYKQHYTSGEHALTTSEVGRLFAACESLEDLALFKLAVASGIRRKDIVRIKWSDVNFDVGFVDFFEHKKDRVKRVFLPDDVLLTLRRLLNSQDGEVYLFPGGVDKKRGKGHISGKTAYNRFQSALREAGVIGDSENKPFHALRATCVKFCQAAGWSPSQTAKHLGDTVRTVQEHYATPSDAEMRDVAKEGLW